MTKINLTRLRIKDIVNDLEVSKNTAQKIYSDMKNEYKTSFIVYEHLYRYLNLNK
ncbi:hypothetical protein KUL152_34760 [Tenacibaculum sp. KUL152]|nr:hypothetical protein KUL152_34760 [Tenacibaculum sp. KUL152]